MRIDPIARATRTSMNVIPALLLRAILLADGVEDGHDDPVAAPARLGGEAQLAHVVREGLDEAQLLRGGVVDVEPVAGGDGQELLGRVPGAALDLEREAL